MKLLLALSLALGAIVNFTSQGGTAQDRGESVVRKEKPIGLQVSLVAHKRRYKRTDQLKLEVMLTNSGKANVYVFGTLDWGSSASFVLHIRDASGKEIVPAGLPDDLTFASPDDKSAFVKLLPDHFLGTNFFSPLDILNLTRPGRYTILAEYNSPFSTTDVKLSPFWGKESGPIRSNVVYIEVLR